MAIDIITRGMVQGWLPSLTETDAEALAQEASAALRVYAPCVDPDGDSDAKRLAVGAIRRILQTAQIVPLGVKVEVRGPLSTTYWDRSNLLLSTDDERALTALCSRVTGVAPAGLPAGDFPAAPNTHGLFAERRHGPGCS